MPNQDIARALRYHNGTKHPAGFLMNPSHRYSYEMEPLKQKIYLNLPVIELPEPRSSSEQPALAVLESSLPAGSSSQSLNKTVLTGLLHYSAGITKRINYPRLGEVPFRAAACTGALYHIELYLVCAELEDLAAGVYHYDPLGHGLTRLRQGDYRQILLNASAAHPALAQAQAVIIYTDMPIRNAVKYQAREYRHAFWDSGTILANSLALTVDMGLPAELVLGFEDAQVNDLLGMNGRDEFALALLPVGSVQPPPPDVPLPLPKLNLQTKPVTALRMDLSAIQDFHQASSLENQDQVAGWRLTPTEPDPRPGLPRPVGELFELPKETAKYYPDPLADVIQRRGSTRQFSHAKIEIDQLGAALYRAYQPLPADFVARPDGWLTQAYLIVNAVGGLPNGAYVYHPNRHALEMIAHADLRNTAAFLALGQDLGRDASASIYFLTRLDPILERFGNRGYRAAQLDASLRAGRIYLAAYAMQFGASGLTFYDDEVTNFFSPHAAGKSVMFLIALGHRAARE